MPGMVCLFLLLANFIISNNAINHSFPLHDMGDRTEWIIKGLNAILGAAPQDRDFVILITGKESSVLSVGELRAPWGVGVFEMEGAHQNTFNVTEEHISAVVAQARKVRVVSWSVTVVVVSDNPMFLETFARWSFRGRLYVWSTRLLVLTHVNLHPLNQLRKTLSMTNSMLLHLIEGPSKKINLYVEVPYSRPGTLPLSFASWTPDKGLTKAYHDQYYFDKFYRLSQGPRLIVSRVVDPTEKTEEVEDPDFPGEKKIIGFNAENQLIETIGKAMNFTIKFIMPADGHWGSLTSDGFWTGMIGMVYREKADLGLGLFTMTPQRYQVVDFTYPVAISYARILAGRGSPEVTFWGFLLPLTPEVWLGIGLALAVYMLVMLLPACLPIQSLKLDRLAAGSFNCVRVLLQQDVSDSEGWWWWERAVVGVWMLMTLVLTKSYAGNLMSLLAVRYIPEPLQSLQDLVDNPVNVLLIKGTAEEEAFRTSTGGEKLAVWNLKDENRLVRVEIAKLNTLNPVLLKTKSALLTLDVYQKKRIAKEFTESGKCAFSLGRSRYIPALESLAGGKDSPLVPAISRKVSQITEGGLYDHWQTWFFPNLTTCLNSPTKFAITSPLAIRNIWGMFVVLTGGWIVSILVLCLEKYSPCTGSKKNI